jgi:putative hydrolase of the HAD superfamily
LHVPAHEVVYVGDDLELDAIAARDAGMTGIWLNRLGTDPTRCPPDVTAISSLDELGNVLGASVK